LSRSKARCSELARPTSVVTGISVPFTTIGWAYTSRTAASASSWTSTGCVHSSRGVPAKRSQQPVCVAVADAATLRRGGSGRRPAPSNAGLDCACGRASGHALKAPDGCRCGVLYIADDGAGGDLRHHDC
jgi:hypothetical protein